MCIATLCPSPLTSSYSHLTSILLYGRAHLTVNSYVILCKQLVPLEEKLTDEASIITRFVEAKRRDKLPLEEKLTNQHNLAWFFSPLV